MSIKPVKRKKESKDELMPMKRKQESKNESASASKTGGEESVSKSHGSKKRKAPHDRAAKQSDKKAKISRDGALRQRDTNGDETLEDAPTSRKISFLREEEPLFPRGGGSVLTPLEHRQINVEAQRDALFEQRGKASRRDVPEEDDPVDEAVVARPALTRRKRAKVVNATESPAQTQPEEIGARIEGLGFNTIVPGMLVLGQVSQITSDDVALSLPNNLTGFIPLTGISSQLTERIQRLMSGMEPDHGKEEDAVEREIKLSTMFSAGRYLRAYVTSVKGKPAGNARANGRRHIELSIDPRLANRGLSRSDLLSNVVVQASVVSVEDHGLIMDLGLENQSVKGFVPSSEVSSEVEMTKVEPGTVFLCIVTGQSPNGMIIKLSANLQTAAKRKEAKFSSDASTIDAFVPGTAVQMSVVEVTSVGLAGKLMGTVDATADMFHSGATSSEKNFEMKVKLGQKVFGRVVCTFPKAQPKKVGISLLDHVRSLSTLKVDKDGEAKDPLDVLPISTTLEQATVVRVVPTFGIWLDLGTKPVVGFAHISKIADERTELLSESTGLYRVGSKHQIKITGYNPIDGLYIVSLRKSVLTRPFLRVEDVEVGQVVKGKIEKLITKDGAISAILVNLVPGVTGLVPGIQFSDVRLTHPEKIFKVGMSVTARVLSNDLDLRRLRLTLKKTLVKSDLPILKSYDNISSGSRFLGVLVKVFSSGATVQFYRSVRAFLPVAEMSEAHVEDPRKDFQVGQVVNARVVSADPKNRKMVVSCKDASSSDSEPTEENRKEKKKRASEAKAPVTATVKKNNVSGLQTAGFDWTASTLDNAEIQSMPDSDDGDEDALRPSKKKRRKAEIKVDRTGDLDAHGPQSVAEFERLLLGEPDSSYLWLQYMAFQLQLGEMDKAREIAERALATIGIVEETEKMNIWIGLLNLENTYGTDESLQEVFKRACQVNDTQEIHERLISICIQSDKLGHADALFQTTLKKFSQSPSVWVNYATFLMTSLASPDRARNLLPRATQALPPHTHIDLTSKFAQLEFRSPNGSPERGRTFFEGLFTTWPKRLDLWNVRLDLEMKRGEKERVRSLFERIVHKGLKPRKAKWFFKRWLEFEEREAEPAGDGVANGTRSGNGKMNVDLDAEKRVERVKARAAQYVLERKERGE